MAAQKANTMARSESEQNQIRNKCCAFADFALTQYKSIKSAMILNSSDPTGFGLFSKIARNQAMKSKSIRPASKSQTKSLRPVQAPHKKYVISDSFSKQESRDQREKKYKHDNPPPVGQYNPTLRERPKLVWDILKVYQHQLQKKKTIEQEELKQSHAKNRTVDGPTVHQLEAMVTNSPQSPHLLSTGDSGSLMASKTSQCMVNMSRMSGRKEQARQNWEWGEGDVLQSLAYVKGPISKNINFDKMLRHPSNPRRSINPATNYSFDYKVLKSRKSALLDFSTIKGREERPQVQPSYSYQHYEYNSYVWQKNSRVYPSTKTHLIEFTRQTNRYRQSK